MHKVELSLAERSYSIHCEYDCLKSAGEKIKTAGLTGNVAIITDSNVAPLYAEQVIDQLTASAFKKPSLHIVPAGEASKSLSVVSDLCSELAEAGHDRKSFIIALGGGVVGDLAGFVAATFFRGIPFVQIPTTIVSLVDSSVGGKTGVNIAQGKNLVGAFHQPKLVLADPSTLSTLEPREYKEGYAEVIKHAAIRDAEMLTLIEALDPSTQNPSADLIAKNIAIKARIVEEDEQELSGTRALLNFGHTIGHGIEAAVPYGELLHGEAISLGIRAALILSEKYAELPTESSGRILALLKKFDLPTTLPKHISTATILEKLSRDKKFSGGAIKFVLLDSLGSAFVSSEVTLDDIENTIEAIRH